MENEGGPRRTERTNVGVPPQRFGNGVETVPKKKNLNSSIRRNEQDKDTSRSVVSSHPKSQESARTIKSVRSAHRKIDKEAGEVIEKLDEEAIVRNRDFQLMVGQEKVIQLHLQAINDKLEDADDEDEKERLVAKRKELKAELVDLQTDLIRAKVNVEFDNQESNLKRKKLQSQAEYQKRQVEDDMDSEEEEDEEDVVDTSEATAKWAEEIAFNPSSNPIDQGKDTAGEAERILLQQLSLWGAGPTPAPDSIPLSKPYSFGDWTPSPVVPSSSIFTSTMSQPYAPPLASATSIHPHLPLSTMASPWVPSYSQPPPIAVTSHMPSFATIPLATSGPIPPRVPTTSSIPTVIPPPVTTTASVTIPSHAHTPTPLTTTGLLPRLEQMVQQMVSRCNATQPGASSSTERILARQVQGGKDLPIFGGRPEEWPAFIVAYTHSTTYCQFSNAENLIRLQKCLKGDALKMVQCLLVSPESVPVVIEKLRMRFGRPDQIIETLIAKARELPAVRIDKLDTLIDLGICVDNLAATIKSLNCLEHLYNPMLIKELVGKLPNASQLEWVRHLQSMNRTSPTVDYFAEWLNVLTNAACTLCPPKPRTEDKNFDRRRSRHDDRVMMAAEDSKSIRNRNNQQFIKSKCPVCVKTGHKTATCEILLKMNVDDRWKAVKDKKLCFSCLLFGHSSQECRGKKTCGKENCQRTHHRLLHKAPREEAKPNSHFPQREAVSQTSAESVSYAREIPFINLLVLPVKLEGPSGTISTYAFLDNGSTLSAMEESLATRLGLDGRQQDIEFSGFQAPLAVMKSKIVSLKIKSQDESFSYPMEKVKAVTNLGLRRQSVRKSLIQNWPHLHGINLETYDDQAPGILIGSDHPALQIQLEHRVGRGSAPVAIRTPLGWALMGKSTWSSREQHSYSIQELGNENDHLHQLVKDQFSTESFGVMPLLEKPRSKEDKQAQSILDKTIKRVNGGWETALLWRDEKVRLPESYATAKRRLLSMEKKMDQDAAFGQEYVKKIQEYVEKGYAKKLTPEEAALRTTKTYYLPHFMAYNPKKPGKLRFVFDAAAKNQGQSLNDHLVRGPDKLVSLPGTLLRFRQRKIGLTADIADMFHRVKVIPEDTEAQRFLWRGLDRDRAPDVYKMTVLIFGATCSPTCAQEVKNRNAAEFEYDYPEAYNSIVNCHYVDDLLDSCDTLDAAKKRFQDVRKIQLAGGFNLRNWLSSSIELMKIIPEDLRASNMKNLSIGEDSVIERVLGMFWKPESDCFTFSLNFVKACEDILVGKKVPTKRQVLSLVMSIYDPLGFLAVLTVKARMLLQEIWRGDIGWDDEIPMSVYQGWTTWLEFLKKIPSFTLPRCYSSDFSSADDLQLHVFADASLQSFGAVAYFRIQKGISVRTVLVMAKAKVAPLKMLTVPKLELQAAVMACRLAEFIKTELDIKINRTVYWSDSSTVLDWIRADGKQFKMFVANRVGEIQHLSNSTQWRWVPTLENVADELTRFQSPCNWDSSSRWLNGPQFLRLEEADWPQQTWDHSKQGDEELKKNFVFHIKESVPLIELNRFSNWNRLIRTTAYVLRYCLILKKRLLEKKGALEKTKFPTELTPEEIENSKIWWYEVAQRSSFPVEYAALQENQPIEKSSRLRNMSPYIDGGVIRIRGRIDNAPDIPVTAKRPVILDPKHPFTCLLIQHYHRVCGHHGTERVLNEIRQMYYVPHLRAAVKGAQHQCIKCRHSKAKPNYPEMAQLPPFRLESHVFPFNKTGMDYFGPIEVVVKRSREKRYGVLFTCLSTRAVHLEIANSLSTDSCILAIRRFVGRRGCPQHIYSDNGTNFHGTNNELQKALLEINQGKMETECSNKGISWHFNPPAAPHMGGSWERMVRSVKTALGAVLKEKNLHDEVLYTLMVEAEHSVNGHPLTHVSLDPNDQEALTPNHFLIGRSSNLQPLGEFDKSDLYGRKQWRLVQELANRFWRRWIREFLPTLLRREKWCQPTRPIQVNDVVLEVNEDLVRNQWPMGIVTKLYPGRDGVTRVVDVKMSNQHIYKRPVAKLCVLDVHRETPAEKQTIVPVPFKTSATPVLRNDRELI